MYGLRIDESYRNYLLLTKLTIPYYVTTTTVSNLSHSFSLVAVNGYEAIKEMETNPDFINKLDDAWALDKSLGVPYGKRISK
jgi:hypothetical protein